MKDLAIVLLTCDRYEFLWEPWYYYFKKNWGIDLPVYFLTETTPCPFSEFIEIAVNEKDFSVWTKKVRLGIQQIPQKNLFILLDDFMIKENIDDLFVRLYDFFKMEDADALRILRIPSAATAYNTECEIDGGYVQRLTPKSKYIISYIPNIWKKEFLLKCISVDEDPWKSEVKGSKRMRKYNHRVYHYLRTDWYMGASRGGKLIPEGEILINNIFKK